jgi:adenylate kinase family enzyme
VIWLDLPLRVTLPRMVRRTWRRWRTHELLWGTNVEEPWQHLRLWEVNRNLFSYSVVHHRSRRRRILAEMRDPQWAHIRFVHLRSPREVEAFTREFEAARAS